MTETQQVQAQEKNQNPMRSFKVEKILLSCGATGQDLEKAKKLLEIISGMKAQIIKSGPKKRIPAFNVKPNMPLGTRTTLRGEKAVQLLKRLLGALNNTLSRNQVADNHFSFGVKEYLEIPGIEYQRDIGIRGLNVTVVFNRPGVRVKRKKIKRGKLPKKQNISQEEILKYMEENFDVEFI